jgi:hypothetical protein
MTDSPPNSRKSHCAPEPAKRAKRGSVTPTAGADDRLVHTTLMAWEKSRAISRRAQGHDLRRDIPEMYPTTFVSLAATALRAPAPGVIPDAPVNNL